MRYACMHAYTHACVCYYMIHTHARTHTQECAPASASQLFAVVLVVKLVVKYSVRCRKRTHIIRRTNTQTCVLLYDTLARTHPQRAHPQALYCSAYTYYLENNAVFSEGLTQTPRVILERVRPREAGTFILMCGFLQRMY